MYRLLPITGGVQYKVIPNKPMSRAKLIAWLPHQSASLVAMESCGGASYLARLAKSLGHGVLVMPARQIKAFRTGQKTDANDAVAIAVASQSPNIHPARYLSSEQQCLQAIEKMHDMLSKQKSQLSNQVRGLLFEEPLSLAWLLANAVPPLSPVSQRY